MTNSHLVALSVVAFFGCASDALVDGDAGSSSTLDGSTTKDGGGGDTGAANKDANTQDVAKVCVDKCTTNTDCMNSCPATAGAEHCCDQGSGKCYAFTGSACPADPTPVDDGGAPPY